MEELGELIIAIIILVVAFAIKIIEMASRKKMPLPLPEIPPEEVYPGGFSEVEVEQEPKAEALIKKPPSEPERRMVRSVIEKPAIPISILSRDELEKGIILSTILGPPRSLFRKFQRKSQRY